MKNAKQSKVETYEAAIEMVQKWIDLEIDAESKINAIREKYNCVYFGSNSQAESQLLAAQAELGKAKAWTQYWAAVAAAFKQDLPQEHQMDMDADAEPCEDHEWPDCEYDSPYNEEGYTYLETSERVYNDLLNS